MNHAGFTHALTAYTAEWPLAFGALVVMGAVFRGVAHSARSTSVQYLWLGLFVVAESILFVPLLSLGAAAAPGVIRTALFTTLAGYVGSTALAFTLRRDLSFLQSLINSGLGLGLIAIVTALAFRFSLGAYFALAMILLSLMAVLHDTSEVVNGVSANATTTEARTADDRSPWSAARERYVAASLSLFASMALMFWYALSLFMQS